MKRREELALKLREAWQKYEHLFGEPPHGTIKQLAAFAELGLLPWLDQQIAEATHELSEQAARTHDLIGVAVAAERERCATCAPKLNVHTQQIQSQSDYRKGYMDALYDLRSAIVADFRQRAEAAERRVRELRGADNQSPPDPLAQQQDTRRKP